MCTATTTPEQSKENEGNWTENHERAIEEIKKAIQAVTENNILKETNWCELSAMPVEKF